ncbi:LysR substrate-binding domain-containing protein [Polycladidibacter hongkongensis]|uniref:LysR substrate-binding domain-containing protein n=1 Tax=Polycladidibacter hongkongensis TaxID=1647556 RepID=UPI000834F0F1|nr:LysR substrate-binding domain-containing protein [Pseudovibrio hongkongensis]
MQHRQVEAFRYVMVAGTTKGAAEIMHISQPAISRLIADLEISLGFKLFDRTGGRLAPTSNALRFLEAVDQYYTGMDRLSNVAQQIRRERPADLKVASTPALSTYFFPQVISKFRERYEDVELVVENMSSAEIVNRLQLNLTQMGVTLAFPEMAGIQQVPIARASHVCAMHQSHPLARKDCITPQDLQGENVLKILPSGLASWKRVEQALAFSGVEYSQSIGIQNSHTGYSLIAHNLAVALIEPFAASVWRCNGVVIRKFLPDVSYSYVVAYSKLKDMPPELQEFLRLTQLHFMGSEYGVVT